MSFPTRQRIVVLLSIVACLVICISCEKNLTECELRTVNPSLKYNPWHVLYPAAKPNLTIQMYNYQTTYWVIHYKNASEGADYINQRWECQTRTYCQWRLYKDDAQPGFRRFQNVETGSCLRVGDGTLDCSTGAPNDARLTPADCKSYADDNCQYFSLGSGWVSSSQNTYYEMRVNAYSNKNCVSAGTGSDLKLYDYTCSTTYLNQWWWFECRGSDC
ncbi:uncharacterized protein LOC110862795 [Folsomia candida]|uniref:Uncharacterized protein n=1 Tax=Folsomia candida TaxID=158441 RepID=A0A226CWF8_FOLCA|nr:uncharacterized protein LOC110862795 [Folsomia candida]OXA36954.1 hypothetical protein Fcan01_28293 [Folsomia candida]